MTLANAIEIVQMQHPDAPVAVIAQYIKGGYRDFAVATRSIKSSFASPVFSAGTGTLNSWNVPYIASFAEFTTPDFSPIGIERVLYDGQVIDHFPAASINSLRYRVDDIQNSLQIITRPYTGSLDATKFSVDVFGFNPAIINSTDYTQEFGLPNPDFEFFAVNKALMMLNITKNLTVQASYYEREMRRIELAARKELQLKKTTNSAIQVRM